MATITRQIHIFSYKPANFQCKLASSVCRVSAGAAAVPRRLRSIRCDAEPIRRSGNYKTTLWDFDYIQALKSQYKEERYMRRASELVEQVRAMLEEKAYDDERVEGLVLIDALQRLGISCHFQNEIGQFLSSAYEEHKCKNYEERDLYSTSLEFRLLRQHGFEVSQEVFDCFKNEKGSFKSIHSGDTKGLLQLYEASFLLTEGEKTLEIAREFSSYFLQKKLDDNDDGDGHLSLLTLHALEVPIHWRVQRPNARWFIDVYEKIPGANRAVLELAKLDFNIVQATYQQELKHVSSWWKSTRLAEKLPFARDRLVEPYFWTVGVLDLHSHGYQRIMLTKVNALVNTIDDIFDVYGTLEELQLFTNAIRRWDVGSIGELPDYMQVCYLALHNLVNEMAYDVLKEQVFVIIPYLRKSWTDLIETYWQEAKWYYEGYKPSLQEYLDNAWISISGPVKIIKWIIKFC